MLIFIIDCIKAFLFYSKPRGIPVEAHRPAVTSFLYSIYHGMNMSRGKAMATYPEVLAQDAVCQSHTGHMSGLWFLPTRPLRLNTNE